MLALRHKPATQSVQNCMPTLQRGNAFLDALRPIFGVSEQHARETGR